MKAPYRGFAVVALAASGGTLVALIFTGAALHVPGAESVGSPRRVDLFVAVLGIAGLVYLGAAGFVWRRRLPRGALLVVVSAAVAMRGIALATPPFLSSDLYRYVWDGRVQAAGINPYRYIPASPALSGLRDAAIYPRINRADYAPTAYPPMAQVIFAAIARLGQSALAVKLAMVGFEVVAMVAMAWLLRLAGLPAERLLIYAWNPLAVWTFAGNGHVDAAAIGLLGLALLARGLRRDGWAGLALGGAILVKFLPLAVAPALFRRWRWRMPLVCAATMLGLYALYAGVGWRVFGFLSGYAGEEKLEGGGLWLLAGLGEVMTVRKPLATGLIAVLAAGLLALGGWVALRSPQSAGRRNDIVRVGRDAAILAACLMLALSPHYPWYYPWLALPCCLYPLWSVLWLSVAPLLLYLDPLNDRFLWSSLVFVPALVLAVADYAAQSATFGRRADPAFGESL